MKKGREPSILFAWPSRGEMDVCTGLKSIQIRIVGYGGRARRRGTPSSSRR